MADKNAALRNLLADAFGDNFNSGTIEILTSADAVLVTFTLNADAFGAASAGVVTLLGVPLTANAGATGVAAKASIKSSGATYTLTEMTVGEGTGDVQLDNTDINSGQEVKLTSFTWTESANTA